MDKAMICSDYRGAKDPATQIRIICELHSLSERTVKQVLKENGYCVPDKIPKVASTGDFGNRARRKAREWTAADTETLRELAGQGLGATAIAKEMQRSDGTVRRKCREYGIHLKSDVRSINPQRLMELAAQGMTASQIANELGFSVESVRSAAWRRGVEIPREKTKPRKTA